MMDRPADERTAVILTSGAPVPPWLARWLADAGLALTPVPTGDHVMNVALRSRPRMFVLDGRGADERRAHAFDTCRRLKRDSFSAIVPVLVLLDTNETGDAFEHGADEVVAAVASPAEAAVRLAAMLRRSDRDVDVHPSTRLPGTRAIERELERRIADREKFAVCYADLDYFKEFNDRYSYFRGNQVIQLLARILHDVVKGLCGEDGFVGHIGGDDFLYVVPIAAMPMVCEEVIRVFDELISLQYSEGDRRAGYFFGKDRRGQLHRVPLMTLSVGVVTNQRRRFQAASEVSELATEMKTYAKTLSGSCWTVDRRRDEESQATPAESSPSVSRVTKTGGMR